MITEIPRSVREFVGEDVAAESVFEAVDVRSDGRIVYVSQADEMAGMPVKAVIRIDLPQAARLMDALAAALGAPTLK